MRARLAVLVIAGVLALTGCTTQLTYSTVSSLNSPSPTSVAVTQTPIPDLVGLDGPTAYKKLTDAGFEVTFEAGTQTVLVKSNWTVDAVTPLGAAPAGSVVTLWVSKHAPTSTPTPTPTVAAADPAPANPAPAPAPADPASAPPPAPPPAAAIIVPGAFCSASDVGASGVAANGRTYVCGGKGPDSKGHYHWNS